MISKLTVLLLGMLICYLPEAKPQASNITKIGYDAGFKSINARKIIKDKYGFIWIGTQDGLYRYDANEFEVFKNNFDGKSLGNNFIIDLAYDGDNYLYITTYEGGLDRLTISDLHIDNLVNRSNKEAWKLFSTLGKLALVKDYILVYTIYGLSGYNIKQGTLTRLNVEAFIEPGQQIQDIYFTGHSNIAIVSSGNMIHMAKVSSGNKSIWLEEKKTIPAEPVKQIKIIDEKVYVLTTHTLSELDYAYDLKLFSFLPTGLNETDVTDIAIGREAIYIATPSGLLQAEINQELSINKKMKFIGDTENELISCLYKDSQEILWIGTYNGLLYTKLNKQKFVPFAGSYELKNPHLYTLLKDNNWMYACATNNLYKVNLLTKEYKIVAGASALGIVHHIINDDNINKIVSTSKGMALLNTITDELSLSKFNSKYPEWRPFIHSYFNNSIEIQNKIYWASENHNGLIVWDKKNRKINQILSNELDSSDFQIHNLKMDAEGYLWLLCNTAVYRVNTSLEKIIQKISFNDRKETFNTPIFFDFYDDKTNYWFATYGGGINKYNYKTRKWNYITEKEGLSNNCVYSLLPGKDGNIWASTNAGITRIEPSGKVTTYTIEDGLQNNTFEEKCYFTDNDTLYLGGLNGFTKIIPDVLSGDQAEINPIIRKIEFHYGNSITTITKLGEAINKFPTGTNSIRITVAIPDFLFRKKYQLFFKINDSKEYLKLENNSIISLNNLQGKAYKISLKITDPNNNERIFDNFYSFSIKPKWHETLLFKVSVVALIAGVLYALYRFRISQLKKVLAERKKIASDLHDDLGGTLNSIRVHSHLATIENNDEHIKHITENTKEAVSGLKDLIWTLDDKKNMLPDLLDKITAFALPALATNNVLFTANCSYECRETELGKEEKRNLYLIFKEAVTNTIKYAEATAAKITAEYSADKLFIIYTDNGKGINQDSLSSGNGIENIKERAAFSGYKATYTNNKETGGIQLILEKKKKKSRRWLSI